MDALNTYKRELLRWNERINLIGPEARENLDAHIQEALAAVAVLSFSLLPGCGLLCGDRGWFGRQECYRGGGFDAIPVSYPVTERSSSSVLTGVSLPSR